MRKYLPWLCFAKPILKQKEYGMYETSDAAKIMWFETLFVYLSFVEKNILLPLIFISALTSDSVLIAQKFGIAIGSAIVVLCGLKSMRSSYSDPSSQYIIILFTVLFFGKDYSAATETFLIDYFVVSIAFKKTCEFLLKVFQIKYWVQFYNKTIYFFSFNSSTFAATIYCNIYCAVANYLGLCVSCICPTLQRTTLSNVISSSCDQFNFIRTIDSIFGQCNISNVLHKVSSIY